MEKPINTVRRHSYTCTHSRSDFKPWEINYGCTIDEHMGWVLTLTRFQFSDQRNKARLTDGWWGKRQWAGARKLDSFVTTENSSKYSDRGKKSSNIHPLLNMNRTSPSLPPVISTSRRSCNVWGGRSWSTGERVGREALAKKYGSGAKRYLPP